MTERWGSVKGDATGHGVLSWTPAEVGAKSEDIQVADIGSGVEVTGRWWVTPDGESQNQLDGTAYPIALAAPVAMAEVWEIVDIGLKRATSAI
jgi:hypothetical protein